MKTYYKEQIMEQVEACLDVDLLDLILKMLVGENHEQHPGPICGAEMGVRFNENNPRDKRHHGAVPVEILRAIRNTNQNAATMGNRCTELPRVCGGADSVSRAA